MNTDDIESVKKMVAGTARSMGVEVEDNIMAGETEPSMHEPWFVGVPESMIPHIIDHTARTSPEDLADLVDMSMLDTATASGLNRHAIVMGSIVKKAPDLPPGLIDALIPNW